MRAKFYRGVQIYVKNQKPVGRMKLSRQLKQWRGLRLQKEAALELGVPLATYRNYERDHRRPRGLARIVIERKIGELLSKGGSNV